jgi:hypothetical protein
MRDPRIRSLIEAIEARYPGTRVVVQRWGGREDPDIRWWLWVLNVPEDRLTAVDRFASRRTTRIYGKRTVPFFTSIVSREQSLLQFAAVLAKPRGSRLVERMFEGFVPAPSRRRRRTRVA